jgi:hypothetical protein
VFFHTKIALLAFVIPFAASAAIANDLETTGKSRPQTLSLAPGLIRMPLEVPAS